MSRFIRPAFFILGSSADEPEALLGRAGQTAFEDLDALYRDALEHDLSLDDGRCVVEVEAVAEGAGLVRPTRILGVHPLEPERIEAARGVGD